jgi:Tfp pilus assembly protein PilF
MVRALKLDPENPRPRFFHAMSLMRNHPDSAVSEVRRGLQTDPVSSELLMVLGFAYQKLGNLDSAARYFREAVDITPTFSLARQVLAQLYLARRQPGEAISQFEQAALAGAARDSAQLAYGYAATNRRHDAETTLRSLLGSAKTRYIPPVSMAMAYVGLHDNAEAFRWLDRAETDNDPMLATIQDFPAFAPLRADPRYEALRRRLAFLR